MADFQSARPTTSERPPTGSRGYSRFGNPRYLGLRPWPRPRRSLARLKFKPRELGASVPIMLGLVRTFYRHANIVRLLLGQLRQLHSDFLEVQPGDFLIEFLRQPIDR